MKRLFLLSSLLLALGYHSNAQTYTTLATDISGDPIATPMPDLKSFSYSMNTTTDKIWFKVELHNSYPSTADFGMMIALDTNKVITDGTTWSGPHKGMKYDHALFIYQNGMFPTYYGDLGQPGSAINIPVTVTRPDNFTFIIETKLSTLDKNANFNLLIGTGSFDIAATGNVYDDAPHTGYLSIPVAAPANKDMQLKLIKPAINDEIVKNKAFEFRARVYNKSTSTIAATERIEVTIKIDGLIVLKDTPAHAAINANDSIDLVATAMKLNNFTANKPNSAFCAEIRPLDFTDPGTTNNSDCKNVNLRLFPSEVSEIATTQVISLYPNPATRYVTIDVTGNTKGVVSFFDLTGKQVLSKQFDNSNKTISLDAFTPGLYLYRVSDAAGNKLSTGKLTINK